MEDMALETRNRFWGTDFRTGFGQGIPIALGYIPVSFTFGLLAVKGGLSPWIAVFISLTNLTSAGQFAGTNLIITGATLLEITATTLVVNIRYILMSLSLSQKVAERITLPERCLLSFGITDETFTVASMHKEKSTFSYMLGLITGPYWGWALGTLLGAMICSVLPETLQNSMGIALYAMFIALVVPNAKKSRAALAVVFIAVAISSAFTWVPYLHGISQGWGIILATIAACLVGAIFFPREEE